MTRKYLTQEEVRKLMDVTGDSSVQGVTAVNSTISVKDASLTTQVLFITLVP
ncbi:TPA: hypothetical protein ACUPQ2_004736 [Escherichia coli]